MATTAVLPASDLVRIDCGRCGGSGNYYSYGACFGCGGRGTKSVSRRWLAAQATAERNRKERHRAGLNDRLAELDRREQATLAALPALAAAIAAERASGLADSIDRRDCPALDAFQYATVDDDIWRDGDQAGIEWVQRVWQRRHHVATHRQILR
jgi:hypothetical protein